MSKAAPQLSIILPSLGEGARVGENLRTIKKFMATDMPEVTYELIVVAANDGKHTADEAEKLKSTFKAGQLTVVRPGAKVGKGRDVGAGFALATGDIQLFTDGDLAIPLINIKKAYNYLVYADLDEINGAIFGIRTAKHNNVTRKVVSGVGNMVTRILFATRFTDLQCGFKAFRREVVGIAFGNLKTTGWAFDVEVFARLQNADIKIHPLKIKEWRNDNDHLSGENILLASIRSFTDMIYIRFTNFSLKALLHKFKIG